MGKKIDLSQKKDNSSLKINKNTHPLRTEFEEFSPLEEPSEEFSEEIEDVPENYIPENDTYNDREFISEIEKRMNKNSFSSIKNKDDKEKIKIEKKTKILLKHPAVKKILLIAIPIIFGLLLVTIVLVTIFGGNLGNNLASGGYYNIRCNEVTVIFTDKQNNYEVTGTGTYPIDEYVAGVVAGEVGFFGDIEVDKAFAIAARSFLLTHDDGNCTIESSDRRQVFRELTDSPTDQLARQAAEETSGKVLLKDNQLFSSQYDAFACIAKDDNYYTISQANQKIPRTWIESKINPANTPRWFICNGKENLQQHHGNGMSQYGSWYLASEQGYTYDQILNYYLGDQNVSISSGFMTSIAGLEIKDTTSSKKLDTKLEDFLLMQGTSVENLDAFVYDSVSSAGKGTREGVVTAAVSLVNYLYDNFNIKIPYYWGGEYQNYGVDKNFGAVAGSSCSPSTCYYKDGFDCSGFVSWAIKNGGYNISRKTTQGFHSSFSKNSCNVKDSNCIGQPGDLINSASCHVQMIVAVDEASGKYYIVESTGGHGLIMHQQSIHASNCGNKETRILFMDEFYNNASNVDPNY